MIKQDETIKHFVNLAKSDFSQVEENLSKIIFELQHSQNKGLNYIESFDEQLVLKQLENLRNSNKKGKLFGVPITVKDAIVVKDLESKAGSRILAGYKPQFDATVIKKAREEGAIILAKTTQDEFGFGTFSTNTIKVPKNPFDQNRSCGGSSGGSGGFTAYTSAYHLSIGESTGGSIACPASYCGVNGLTPTYGLVSRNGLIDYANSLDKIGAIGRNTFDSELLLNVISGKDEMDSTNLGINYAVDDYDLDALDLNELNKDVNKIAVIKDFYEFCDQDVKKVFDKQIEKLREFVEVEEVSLPLNVKYALSAYYIIATSEASTNLAKLSGLRYGIQEDVDGLHFDDYFSLVRSANFSDEAKRRIILGTFARMSGFRDAYYLKSLKVRTKLINEFKSAFKNYDLLLNPTMSTVAPRFDEIEKLTPIQNYAMDLCTVPANLAGLPHLSSPIGFSQDMPVGLMTVANHLEEKKLTAFGKLIEMIN
ncbi:MAG: amidase family protein [Candidatus ainarchaeum sp.]|nr:amidase family protein [Candidatus ainarchaeum sp.]